MYGTDLTNQQHNSTAFLSPVWLCVAAYADCVRLCTQPSTIVVMDVLFSTHQECGSSG